MRHAVMTGTAVGMVLALSACSGGAGTDAANTTASANAADLTPEGPGLTARLFGGGKPQSLQIQQKFANGAILYVTSMQAKPTETVVGVKVVNGADRDIRLGWSDQKTFLVAGGQKFWLSPPLENKEVKVTEGSTMQGELVFLGTLPQTGQVTLVINDGQSDSQYNDTPGVSIPLPVTSAAWSDDGSKKNLAV